MLTTNKTHYIITVLNVENPYAFQPVTGMQCCDPTLSLKLHAETSDKDTIYPATRHYTIKVILLFKKVKKKNRNNVASKLDIILFMLLRHINKMFVHCLISNTLLPTFVSVKVNLYGGISTRIKDLSGVDLDNRHVVGP